MRGVGWGGEAPPPVEERELDDLCVPEARLLHSFRVILAVPPPVKLASKAAAAHQARGALMGRAWLFEGVTLC